MVIESSLALNQQSERTIRFSRRPAVRSGLDRRLIDQHDGNVVFDGIDPVTLGTLQTLRVLTVFERLFAGRTNQNFQKVFGNHNWGIVRQEFGGGL
jgi:hypothetical protein